MGSPNSVGVPAGEDGGVARAQKCKLIPHPTLPCLSFISLGERWSSRGCPLTWTVVCSKQAGWVFVVGPHGAWEEMKVGRFFLTV